MRRARARSAVKAVTSPSSVRRGRASAPAVTELRVPTNLAMLGGRTYTGGPDDYAAVHALQDQYRLVPLSSFITSGITWGQAVHAAGQRTTQRGRGRKDPGAEASAGTVARRLLQPSQSPVGDEPARTRRSEDDGAPGDARHRTGSDVPDGRVHTRGAQGDRGRRRRRDQG